MSNPLAGLDDWLGHAAADLTDDQRDRFETAVREYYDQPHHDKRDPEDAAASQAEDDAALSAILESILGEGTLQDATARYLMAKAEIDGWIRAAAALGMSEVEIAEKSPYTRITVRTRLGRP